GLPGGSPRAKGRINMRLRGRGLAAVALAIAFSLVPPPVHADIHEGLPSTGTPLDGDLAGGLDHYLAPFVATSSTPFTISQTGGFVDGSPDESTSDHRCPADRSDGYGINCGALDVLLDVGTPIYP